MWTKGQLRILFVSSLLILFSLKETYSDGSPKISKDAVKRWAWNFGKKLVEASSSLSCLKEIEEGFAGSDSDIQQEDAAKMLDEFRKNIAQLFEWKKQHVAKIAIKAEEESFKHIQNNESYYDYFNMNKLYDSTKNQSKESEIKAAINYYEELSPEEKVRELNKWHDLQLQPHPKFKKVPVNLSHSGVHIPVNVFNEKPELMQGIEWSTKLTDTFKSVYRYDPEVSWQFFCSSDGFMRLYPASKWRVPQYLREGDPLDLYDCRLRNWYIKSAASPRDIVILLDRSGSMTGQRAQISQNVVFSILESLTDDDFVTILVFRENVTDVAPCYGRRLVQANKQNIAVFKKRVKEEPTSSIANFPEAFIQAFEVLGTARSGKTGAQCNQAVMLITDGAPENYLETFRELNSDHDEYGNKIVPARVFTYLVGKEVTDIKEVHDMACENRGYYTHVANMAEVREQVQLYVPVMSRPLVIKKERVFTYTTVYTDVTDVPLLNWVWDGRERERIRENIQIRIKENENPMPSSDTPNYDEQLKPVEVPDEVDYESQLKPFKENETLKVSIPQRQTGEEGLLEEIPKPMESEIVQPGAGLCGEEPEPQTTGTKKKKRKKTGFAYPMVESRGSPGEGIHDLMLTISAPVFDQKNFKNVVERYLEKNVKRERTVTKKSAELLGVAGVDIPIRQLVRYTPAYRIGVNGYSFAINNNGYILYHPDLRPLFQDLIKPFYNAVDLNEVEFAKNYNIPRKPDESVQTLRRKMLQRETNTSKIEVKMHLDSMKRVVTRTNIYYYGPIGDSPFVLAVALPKPYGNYRFTKKIDILASGSTVDYSKYFQGTNWRVHPEWFYCNQRNDAIDDNIETVVEERTPEEELINALSVLYKSRDQVKWHGPSVNPLIYTGILCDKDLLQYLLYDAKATDIDLKTCGQPRGDRLIKNFGIALNFVATRSGLTRFYDHREEGEKANCSSERIFGDKHKRATDELFYQRAVDYNRFNSTAFIFSVPFEPPEEAYVLGARAIFFGSGMKKAPAATVGMFFKQKNFAELFFNTSSLCSSRTCDFDCTHEDINCFVIDNNGFVVVSENSAQTGQFFGEVDMKLFKALVDESRIYKEITMFDYQSICIEPMNNSSSFASCLQTPWRALTNLVLWLWSNFVIVAFDLALSIFDATKVSAQYFSDYEGEYGTPEEGYAADDKGKRLAPNRTTASPCDKIFYLYEMYRNVSTEEPYSGTYNPCEECSGEYIAQIIPNTNLLLLISNYECSKECETTKMKINPTKIDYDWELGNRSCVSQLLHVDRYRVPPNITCINFDEKESEIEMCGKGCHLHPSLALLFILLALAFLLQNQ